MKKNVLALSIAAMIGGLGFAGAASADVIVGDGAAGKNKLTVPTAKVLEVADGGVGHMLLVPYYNAQNGNMTVLHVVNTDTKKGKAVKVRFRGAANSDDVLDFQVFMSPGDVWTAAVTKGADGVAQIVTADTTCTVPALKSGVAQSFVTSRLNPATDVANNSREGYVEILNMADIPEPAAADLKGSLFEAIKHVKGVAPCSSTAASYGVVEAAALGVYTVADDAASKAGFDSPTGGLMGDWYIINVAQTTTFSGATTAVIAKDVVGPTGKSAPANFVHFAQSATAAATPENFTADPLFRAGSTDGAGAGVTAATIKAANYDLPDLSTPYVTAAAAAADPLTQAAALTGALAVKSVSNQYANDASITAKTDWVFSMPSRRYSVAANYAAAKTTDANYRLFSDLGTKDWFTKDNTSVVGDLICVKADGQAFWDREENTQKSGAVFSPSQLTSTSFCGETSVLSFADAGNSVLAASVARQNVSGIYENGWSVVGTTNGVAGLPILGSAFIKLTNPSVSAGMSGTYGITWPHRFTK